MFGSLLFTVLVGCGGGGDSRPDAKIFLDAPVDAPPMCAVVCQLKPPDLMSDLCVGANYTSIRFGGGANGPVAGDWYTTFGADAGGLANRKALDIVLAMSPSSAGQLQDILIFRVLKPTTGGFPINTPIMMEGDPNAATPAAWSFWLGNATVLNNMIQQSPPPEQFLWANGGSSVTLMMAGEQVDGLIDLTTTGLTWRELDDNNADVPGGCTTAVGMGANGFEFHLKQDVASFQSSGSKSYEENGIRVLTGAERESALRLVDQRFSHLWH
jgi:hypothetical protein